MKNTEETEKLILSDYLVIISGVFFHHMIEHLLLIVRKLNIWQHNLLGTSLNRTFRDIQIIGCASFPGYTSPSQKHKLTQIQADFILLGPAAQHAHNIFNIIRLIIAF